MGIVLVLGQLMKGFDPLQILTTIYSIYVYLILYIYGSNSLKCQASFKKQSLFIFFAEDCNYLEASRF